MNEKRACKVMEVLQNYIQKHSYPYTWYPYMNSPKSYGIERCRAKCIEIGEKFGFLTPIEPVKNG